MICESKNLAKQLKNTSLVLQVIEVTFFSPENAKKNIKARVTLSDGVSQVICMIHDKIFEEFVSIDY